MKPLVHRLFLRRLSTGLKPYFDNLPESTKVGKIFDFTPDVGLFGIKGLEDAKGFSFLQSEATARTLFLVGEALHRERKRKMVEIFDDMSNSLCKVADLAEFVRIGHPESDFRAMAQEASLGISREVEKLNVHRELYDALKKVVEEGDIVPTTEMDKEVAKLFLYDFEQSGVHLDEADRDKVLQLNDFILHVGSFFSRRTSEPSIVPKSEVPTQYRHKFPAKGDNLVIRGLFSHADDEKLRQLAFKLYYKEDEHRETLLKRLLLARHTLAKLCGFSSFAERAVRGGILSTPDQVNQFISCFSEALKPLAQDDYNRLLALKRKTDPSASKIKAWDPPYYTESFKNSKLSSVLHKSVPYFSLGVCMDGLNHLFNSLFGINLIYCKPGKGELWNDDVIKLAVFDSTENELGHIYCDLFEREEKPHQDCHFTIQGGCKLADGSYQKPIVVLVLSLPKPTSYSPSLLSPHQVDNLFHEMGHAIHSILARTPYQHITGTRCSTDLAEVPSILMEYFIQDPRVVSSFAEHYSTGEQIPKDLLDTWIASKKFFNASETQLQLFYAALDQAYHGQNPLLGQDNTNAQAMEICEKYFQLGYIPGVAWQLRFGHLVGYGAKYYSYLVSRSVARLIWVKHFADNPFSKEAGHIYQNKVLAHGGGKPAADIVEDILEQRIGPEYLSKALIDDIVDCSQRCNEYL